MVRSFRARGWEVFPAEPAVADWVTHALPAARAAVRDPAHLHWLDCQGTWFIGVDALPNDAAGQGSVVYPGYPRPRRGESETAARYRVRRDGAHVDGLKPTGPDRRRHVDEPHAWILGLPLTEASADAAPLVVWDGSHRIMQAALRRALAGVARADWATVDITEAYQAARREVFETCPRIEIPARPGEAIALHRHCLHGVAPWRDGATAGPDGRMIAYFRPELPGGVAEWIETP